MSNRFVHPRPQFMNSTPTVYSGGSLNFYISGTSTPKNVYSDAALSASLGAELTLNSAGYYANEIFLAEDAAYKVVLEDSSGSVVWTADPVSGSGFTTNAQFLTYAGNPNGNVAGTAGTGTIQSDVLWDRTNNILYVCTTTGTTSTAVWTAVNASASTPAVPQPQGRLTLTSATPVMASGVASAGTIYYAPHVGELVPIYNGTTTVPTEFSELTLTLASQHAANTIYDVFVFSNSGVLTLVTGPAWTSSAAGSSDRGSGASSSQISRLNGFFVNTVQITGRNGAVTHTIAANRATYLGSILIDGSAGQVTCHTAYGQSRYWGVWNAYNKVPVTLRAGDSTASWAYSTNTVRASNGSSANGITIVRGLAETYVSLVFTQKVALSAATVGAQVGVGVNSTTSISGMIGIEIAGIVTTCSLVGSHQELPALGRDNYTALESGNGNATATFSGSVNASVMTAEFLA